MFIGTELVSCTETKTYKPPEDRNIGMVFLSYAVWPHMNVFANVAHPLKVRGTSKKTIREKVDHVLDLVHLKGRLHSEMKTGERVVLGPQEVRATGPAAADDLADGSPVWMTFTRVLAMPF